MALKSTVKYGFKSPHSSFALYKTYLLYSTNEIFAKKTYINERQEIFL